MLFECWGQRRRRWPNIKTALGECLVFSGVGPSPSLWHVYWFPGRAYERRVLPGQVNSSVRVNVAQYRGRSNWALADSWVGVGNVGLLSASVRRTSDGYMRRLTQTVSACPYQQVEWRSGIVFWRKKVKTSKLRSQVIYVPAKINLLKRQVIEFKMLYPLQVVSRYRDPRIQAGKNNLDKYNLRSKYANVANLTVRPES